MFFHAEKSPEEIQDKVISHGKEVTLLLSTIFSITSKKKNVNNWWNGGFWNLWKPPHEGENFKLNENMCNQSLNPFEWTLKLRDHKTAAPHI